MKLIGIHHLLYYNDDLNISGANICTIKENTEVVSNEIGLELNDKKTKYMVMSRDQHAVQNHNTHTHTHTYIYIYIYIQGVPGGMYQT